MGEFSRVGSRSFVYRLVTRLLVSGLVAALIGVALYLVGYGAHSTALPITIAIDGVTPFAVAGLTLLVLVGATLLVTIIEYENLGFHIDEHAIFLRQGFFAVNTETIPFFKVINTSFDQSAWQRLFGVGQLIIDQDDDRSVWSSIDKSTASQIIEMVSTKGNIQPVDVSSGRYQAKQPNIP